MEELAGQIRTLDLDLAIRLVRLNDSPGGSHPSHCVLTRNRAGQEFQIGSAWRKTIQAAHRQGEEFLSIMLDDPTFATPLNVVAFKNGDGETWNIVWRRRPERPDAASAPAA